MRGAGGTSSVVDQNKSMRYRDSDMERSRYLMAITLRLVYTATHNAAKLSQQLGFQGDGLNPVNRIEGYFAFLS